MTHILRKLCYEKFLRSCCQLAPLKRNLFDFLRAKKEFPYLIRKPTRKEFDKIVREMYRSYYPDEPVCFSLRFRCDPKLDELVYDALDENLSVIAKCKFSGNIIAVSVNCTTNPWDPNLLDRLACTLSSSAKNILHLQAHLLRAHDLWKYYGIQKIFDVRNLFVKREERKSRLSCYLINASRAIAADCGYQIVRINSTNHYLSRSCERINLKLAYELPYCIYVGPDHTPVVLPPPPHMSARVYIDTEPHLATMN